MDFNFVKNKRTKMLLNILCILLIIDGVYLSYSLIFPEPAYKSNPTRCNDCSYTKVDPETGEKVTCGFWIGFAMQHTTRKSCATDKELEEARKREAG